ncbi:hypothetical protein J6590_020878 [Homalodisca vitripennis]|nr:hypothetical protein J6590_020878 [Homalodisca vitripennis]
MFVSDVAYCIAQYLMSSLRVREASVRHSLSLLQMASRLASNGNQSGLENNGEQIKSEDIQMKSESGDMETNQADSVKAGEYVRELLKEKMALDPAQWPNAMRLVDQGKTNRLLRFH